MDLFELSATLGLDTSSYESGLKGASDLATSFGTSVQKIATKAIETAARASWDFLRSSVETGMGFDRQMSAVQAVLGKEEGTLENMNRLREYGLSVAQDSIFTAEETAEAYYYMGMAGWKTEKMLAGLPGVINLAAASGESLGMVSDIVTDSLTAFQLGAGQAARYADILAATATNSNTDVARMGKTFQYVAPIAGALGYAVEDVATSIGLIAGAGIKGSMAGTSLRNIMNRIATNAGVITDAQGNVKEPGALDIVEDLGVDFFDRKTGKARPWMEFLTDLRAAWRELDPAQAERVAEAFGDVGLGEMTAEEVMSQFNSDLDEWITTWNTLTTETERESFANNLSKQFEALGIDMRDSNGNLREFSDIAHEARLALSEMTDKDIQFNAKKIGSLRGIAAFLRLMNATDEEFLTLYDSVLNSTGAAAEMADARLDNLWGDLVHFNSALGILKVAIYDDIKGPMREVVQYGTGAIQRITNAVNKDGLAGGIHQLGTELHNFADFARPLLEEVGRSLAPVVSALVSELMDQLDLTQPGILSFLTDVGINIGESLILGITNGLENSDNPVAKAVYGLLGGGVEGALSNASAWKNFAEGLGLPGWMQGVAAAFGMSTAGIDFGMGMYGYPREGIVQKLNTDYLPPSTQRALGLRKGHFGGATGGGGSAENGVGLGRYEIPLELPVDLDTDQAISDLSSDIDSGVITDALTGELSDAGASAATNIVSDIQSALLSSDFFVNVVAQITGETTSHSRSFAQGMSGGRILRGSTIFGVGEDGRALQGGESGPEAVVGVNSLNQMIQSSVSSAVGAMLSRMDAMVDRISNYAPQIYLDTGALVGGLAPGMNGELNDIARWKGYGRS